MDKHLHIISRKKAKELGMKEYFTGEPCKNGGVDGRFVSNYGCTCKECRQNVSDYYENNKEAILAQQREYNKRHSEHISKTNKAYRTANKDRVSGIWKRYREDNREVIRKRNLEYKLANREELREKQREYCKKNPQVVASSTYRRRLAKMHRRTSGECELLQLIESEAACLAKEREEMTGFAWHIDHMIPLRANNISGLHMWSNLQVIPAQMNLSKRNKMIYTEPFEWTKYLEE